MLYTEFNGKSRIYKVTGIDAVGGSLVTPIDLFTTDANSGSFYVTRVIVRTVTQTGVETSPYNLSIGTDNPGYSDITSAQGSELLGFYKSPIIGVGGANVFSIPPNTPVKALNASLSDATTKTVDLHIIGYYA